MEEKITGSVKKHFKPEFLNRLDNLVIFKTIDKAALRQVIEIELGKLKKRLAGKKIILSMDEDAKNFLVEKGYQPEMGARPIRRVVEQYIEDPLAEKLLREPGEDRKIAIALDKDQIIFREDARPDAEKPAKKQAQLKS